MLRIFILSFIVLCSCHLYSQKKFDTTPILKTASPAQSINFNYGAFNKNALSPAPSSVSWHLQSLGLTFQQSSSNVLTSINSLHQNEDGSIWITFDITPRLKNTKNLKKQAIDVVAELPAYFKLTNADKELQLVQEHRDAMGEQHLTFHQYHNGVRILNAEIKAHTRDERLTIINGKTYEITDINTTPSFSVNEIIHTIQNRESIKTITTDQLKYIGGEQFNAELVLYPSDSNITLAYLITLYKDITASWTYIVDANTGDIIEKHTSSCKFHYHHPNHDYQDIAGPTTATEPNLAGIMTRINVYEQSGINYLLNVSERMFNPSTSVLPNEPVGGILTLNANNTSPANDDFSVDHIISTNNRWNDRIAVTAHDNATQSFRYFDTKFNRLSFDGKGATIYSFINVSEDDGSGMDNAFWNGFALFYGNGNQAFRVPLAAAKDVAAHEMAHGVIQNTANLNYQGESGALNESFADIFGVLIDRDDWTLGEEVVNRNIFTSGALRSLSDPHNGGRSLNDPGYQPRTVAEKYTGREDNGGVHINSGITNYAFYLFASHPNVGLNRAEQIYFKALSDYLRSSSNFIDLRIALTQSTIDLFGNDPTIINPLNAAFDQVGIIIDGSTPTAPVETTYEVNPGDDFVLWYKHIQKQIVIRTVLGEIDDIVSTKGLLNTPSISDDGDIILFIGLDTKMYALLIDWNTGQLEERLIEGNNAWRNVAISRDGNKIAAITGNLDEGIFDNKIIVFDLINGTNKAFELFNPTTAQGVKTGDVLYADAIQWDHTSQFVMYDASNQINSLFNDPIRYWDIGFLRAWDNDQNTYDDGQIFKLFPSLPEKISVGNPTFSNTSPDIIALDVVDNSGVGDTEYSILGVNLETGAQGTLFENNTIGYPNYSRADDLLLFNVENNGAEIIGVRELAANKISGQGQPFIFINDGIWGTWFANGNRDLTTDTEEITLTEDIRIIPNPAMDQIKIEMNDISCTDCRYAIYNNEGQSVMINKSLKEKKNINISELPAGIYQLVITGKNESYSQRFVKM